MLCTGHSCVCGRTVLRGLQFAFDSSVRCLRDFPVPHDRKTIFGKKTARASFHHVMCAYYQHEACVEAAGEGPPQGGLFHLLRCLTCPVHIWPVCCGARVIPRGPRGFAARSECVDVSNHFVPAREIRPLIQATYF